MTEYDAEIIVVGAGPVGMSAALQAASRGKSVLLIEARPAGSPAGAKCNSVAARTMETFRRFGVADDIRNAGLPDDFPTDATYATALTGIELTRLKMPSRAERKQTDFIDSDWRTPEPMVRVSQIYIEPILEKQVMASPTVTTRYETVVLGYTQDAEGVSVQTRGKDGAESTLRAQYLIGSDGASSTIRKAMNVRLTGDAELARTRSSLIRAPGIKALFKDRPVWMTWVVNHKVRGVVVAIDGRDTWLVHRALPFGETDFETLDLDQSLRDVLGVDKDFEYEVLNHEDWIGRRMVASKMRDGRVLIAGDAAHLWVPFAGYGMNAGIADGVSAAWLICNTLDGWAGPTMIDAYEAERHPITEQVSKHAMKSLVDTMDALGQNNVPKAFASRYNPAGGAMRAVMSRKLAPINEAQFAPSGLNFGYYYARSPIISYDGEKQPDFTMDEIIPSTVPGCRMPHFFEGDGGSIYDRLGQVYSLICFDPAQDTAALTDPCEKAGIPLVTLHAKRPANDPAFGHNLLIVRQDQHVVWRGDACPDDPSDLIATLSGQKAASGEVQ